MPKSQIGSMTSSGQMDVNSNSDEPTQIDYRTVDIIGIGVLELQSQFEITPGLTYDDLSVQICQLVSNQTLVALVSTFGPYPVFRYPLNGEAISPSARRIYIVDEKEDASLVIVRTHDEDVVVPISLSAEDYQSSMELAITRVILAHGYSPISVKDCLGISDIGNQNVAKTRFLSEPAHPTIAFVETESRSLEVIRPPSTSHITDSLESFAPDSRKMSSFISSYGSSFPVGRHLFEKHHAQKAILYN
ncbi:hypothetical protein FRC20_001030 [Serendipita sp. 405]|nr:hypothetical protein FRC15_000568 [Serendipita sp. 397]KAG8876692.1 hypothetical protein FRC20_001030 [Serendipita sp. 405]